MTPPSVASLFAGIPADLPDELTTIVAQGGGVRVERIVSHGHSSPADFWYDQDEDEWVVVLTGAARLEIADRGEITLNPGDWIDLPAGLRHRVSWTTPDANTIWLAVFRPAS